MAGFNSLANRLLTKFGFTVTVNNYTQGEFNVNLGEREYVIESTVEAVAAYTKIRTGELENLGYNYNTGDKAVLLNVPVGFVINVGSELVIDGIKHTIEHFEAVMDSKEIAVHKLLIRENKND